MIDQDVGRLWAEHHDAFGRWVENAARSIGDAFRTLSRIQYDRPWIARPRGIARGRARH